MKRWTTLVLVIFPLIFWGQEKVKLTKEFTIRGAVKKEQIFSIEKIRNFRLHSINDLVITNHLGVAKKTVTGLKGILLKDVLDSVLFAAENPKLLSAFYFIFVAADGYKVVYSWNEIFNTETGNHVYIITEKEGKDIRGGDENILVLNTTDFNTGRRYIKGLSEIIVAQVQ